MEETVDSPSLSEVREAVKRLKNNKAWRKCDTGRVAQGGEWEQARNYELKYIMTYYYGPNT